MGQITSVVERGGVGGARAEGEATEPDQSPTPVRGNHGRGVMPDAYGLANRWRWDRDVPWAIEAATEDALDSADEPPAQDLSA